MSSVITYLKAAIMIISAILSSLVYTNLIIVSYLFLFFLPKITRNKVAHWLSSLWGKSIVWATPGWSVTVEGREHLENNQRYVFVANHESATDICVMYFANLQFRWLSKDSVFKIPFIGTAMHCAGYIPITRGSKASHNKALASSVAVVKSGVPMLYFPEGTRSKSGELNPFKIGAFKLAVDTEAQIVPICLKGTKDLLKKGSFLPGRAKVTVKILNPIEKKESEELDQYASRVRDLILAER